MVGGLEHDADRAGFMQCFMLEPQRFGVIKFIDLVETGGSGQVGEVQGLTICAFGRVPNGGLAASDFVNAVVYHYEGEIFGRLRGERDALAGREARAVVRVVAVRQPGRRASRVQASA